MLQKKKRKSNNKQYKIIFVLETAIFVFAKALERLIM